MKQDTLLSIFHIITLCALIVALLVVQFQFQQVNTRLSHMEMWTFEFNGTAVGKYSYDGYYCVSTLNKNIEQINNTEYHEGCHALVHQDWEHFCNSTTLRSINNIT